MKIGSVEGTPEEINNFFQNHGLNPFDYFEKPESSLQTRWLLIPTVMFVASFALLALVGDEYLKIRKMLFLSGLALSVWLSFCVHIRFKITWGMGAIILAAVLIMLVAGGELEPKQIIEYYRNDKLCDG